MLKYPSLHRLSSVGIYSCPLKYNALLIAIKPPPLLMSGRTLLIRRVTLFSKSTLPLDVVEKNGGSMITQSKNCWVLLNFAIVGKKSCAMKSFLWIGKPLSEYESLARFKNNLLRSV